MYYFDIQDNLVQDKENSVLQSSDIFHILKIYQRLMVDNDFQNQFLSTPIMHNFSMPSRKISSVSKP